MRVCLVLEPPADVQERLEESRARLPPAPLALFLIDT